MFFKNYQAFELRVERLLLYVSTQRGVVRGAGGPFGRAGGFQEGASFALGVRVSSKGNSRTPRWTERVYQAEAGHPAPDTGRSATPWAAI